MKVLLFNGSIHANGCTNAALTEIANQLRAQGFDAEILQIGTQPIQDCTACRGCANQNACVFNNDVVNTWLEKAQTADAFVFGTPVYYAHPAARLLAAMDRMFYAGGKYFQHKPAAVIATARRAGTTASIDVLLKHLTISQMPVVSSTYWPLVYRSKTPTDLQPDAEGLQTMRNLANNLAWLLRCIDNGKKGGITPPQNERAYRTDFIAQ